MEGLWKSCVLAVIAFGKSVVDSACTQHQATKLRNGNGIFLNGRTTDKELEAFLEECSKSSFDPSPLSIDLHGSLCTRRSVLSFMRKLLELHAPTIDNGKEYKCLSVFFAWCTFSQPDTAAADEQLVRDIHSMLFTIACRSSFLSLIDSADIVTLLLTTPNLDHVEVSSLWISQKERLSDWEFSKLGTIVQESITLTNLDLALGFDVAPPEFLDALANSIHLQSLYLSYPPLEMVQNSEQVLSNLIGGLDGVHHGPVPRLLQNPQNQLCKLMLSGMGMTDPYLIALVQFLPTSHLEIIGFCKNRIHMPGFLEFARHLPRIQSLKTIFVQVNPWENSTDEELHRCGDVLLQGIMENTNIQYIDSLRDFPQAKLLWYYLLLNKAGRGRFLQASTSSSSSSSLPMQEPHCKIPDGLWPYLLARKIVPSAYFYGDWRMTPYRVAATKNIVYFILQNCPQVLSYR